MKDEGSSTYNRQPFHLVASVAAEEVIGKARASVAMVGLAGSARYRTPGVNLAGPFCPVPGTTRWL